MGGPIKPAPVDPVARPQRDRTDESLRVERDAADQGLDRKRRAHERKADEVVRVARERADTVIQAARDAEDGVSPSPPTTATADGAARERADAVVDVERAAADETLKRERALWRGYLDDFLASEREATDEHLLGERAAADAAVTAREEVLATVSHDLRSLLSGLSLRTELLSRHAPEGALGDEIRAYAETHRRLLTRTKRLLGDLLDIASIDAGTFAIVPTTIDVDELVRETLAAFGPSAAAKRVTLEGDAPAIRVRLDGDRVLQVLANLVHNAIKFTDSGGRVSIRVARSESGLELSVRDTGVGIPQGERELVFERHHQVRTRADGHGLGLSISKSIVEAHGGRMWVESEVGVGSTFRVTLPVVS